MAIELKSYYYGSRRSNSRTYGRRRDPTPSPYPINLSQPISWHSIQHALKGLPDEEDRHASDSGVSI